MVTTGDAVPYHIIQPSTDDYIQIFFPDVNYRIIVALSCSLNVSIPANMTVTWLRNDRVLLTQTQFYASANTSTLFVYKSYNQFNVLEFECVFNNTAGYTVRRSITVLSK